MVAVGYMSFSMSTANGGEGRKEGRKGGREGGRERMGREREGEEEVAHSPRRTFHLKARTDAGSLLPGWSTRSYFHASCSRLATSSTSFVNHA